MVFGLIEPAALDLVEIGCRGAPCYPLSHHQVSNSDQIVRSQVLQNLQNTLSACVVIPQTVLETRLVTGRIKLQTLA